LLIVNIGTEKFGFKCILISHFVLNTISMTAVIILLGNIVPIDSLEVILIHLGVNLRDLIFEDIDQSFVRSIATASTVIVKWLEHLVLDTSLNLLHEIA